jgi:uncharacterized MAPEG superfamily protein
MTVALWCVFIAGFLPIACTAIAKWGFKGFDNHNPRDWLSRQTGWRARAHAAQANSWEAFALFSAAVFAAHLTHAPQPRVDALAIAFIAIRLVYIVLYLTDRAGARTVVWVIGVGLYVALFTAGA